MKILSVGSMEGISNTCRLRNVALSQIADQVDVVNTSDQEITFYYRAANKLFNMGLPVRLPDRCNENKKIINYVGKNKYDIVWIDKGITINPETLNEIKRLHPEAKIVSYSPDNMALRHNQSQNYLEGIPLYDVHFTMKPYILDDMRKLGARNIFFVNQSYEESFHYPRKVSQEDVKRLGGDVGFVGMWEKERMDSILYLTRHGVKVRIFGNEKWQQCRGDNPNLIVEDHGLYDDDYAKSFKCFKISLYFLRKINFDQQTSRTMEIPACGGFMLAERTEEHMGLFEEGKEAEFFSSDEELLEKCRYYLEHDVERNAIAESGLKRCRISGYSNEETLRRLVDICMNLHDAEYL